MRTNLTQIIILLLFVFLLFGDVKKTTNKVKNLFNYLKRKIK